MLAGGNHPRLLEKMLGRVLQPLVTTVEVLTNDQRAKHEKHRRHDQQQPAAQSKIKHDIHDVFPAP